MKRVLILFALAGLFTGCSTSKSIYSWGRYEDLIYTMYAAPGKALPEMQIEKMEEDYQKARAKDKQVHPGFHAHLGYLYAQIGKLDQAKQELETEKNLFPESAVFIDRMLANLQSK